MSTPNRYRIRQTPTDVWSIRERLCLASSVLRSGDQNWVSVSRAIKPFGEPNRPPDWFSQKNCALQYSDLLEKVEAPKRKRWDRADKETPGDLIVRKLTMERVEELKKSIQERQIKHRKLKREIEMVRCGHLDDKLDDLLNQIKDEMKAADEAEKEHQKWLEQREEQIAALKAMPRIASALSKKKVPGKISRVGELKRRNSSQSEQSEQDSAVESPISEPHSIEVDDAVSPSPATFEGIPCTPTKMAPPSSVSASQHPTPSTSPLLTSLLKSPTPTAPASPISSLLGSPSQPKEGTLASQLTSPRSISTPQPFFNPTSALATAAARQLAVATASLAPSGSSLFPSDKQDSNPSSSASSLPPIHSVTLSAPTLSKLLEMPPSVPGKLPPLPIVHHPISSAASTSSSTVVDIQPKPVEKSASVPETVISVSESSSVVPPVNPASEVGTSSNEKIISVAVKVEPPENVTVPSVPEETRGNVRPEVTGVKKEDIVVSPTLEPSSPTGAVVAKGTEIEINKDSIMRSTDIVIEGKGNDSSQGEEQVIVMEVDFAGQVKDEKGEIIEVFEVTAPEGSIVELEYETICDEEEPSKVEEHLEIRQEEKPHDVNAISQGEVSDLQVTITASQTKENIPLQVTDTKEEIRVPDVKVQEDNHSKTPDVGHTKEVGEHEVDTAAEVEPSSEEKLREEQENKAIVENQPEESESLQNIPVDNQTVNEDLAKNEQDESQHDVKLEHEADVEPSTDYDIKEKVQLLDADETKDSSLLSASRPECTPVHDGKSISVEPIVKEEAEDEVDEDAEEELTTAVKKSTSEKDEPEPIKEEKLVEVTTKAGKRTPKKGRRGRARGGGKTFTDIEVESKPFQDDICKSKDDEDEDDNEQKMELDRIESAAESETSEVVSLVDHSVESTAEPVSDPAAEASGDSDENFTANEGEDISKDNIMGIESLEEESVADQSQISAESEDKLQAPSSVTDSIPNSPASTAPSDDQESIREYKVWKKAIMLVWRAAANHKFANVFLHPVTNDVAPGYHGIVYRPMDLSVIKKNIENGVIRSTIEFQRDMMLMFQNAIMYNNSDHDVYHMALEMQKEVMEQIQDFLATQLMLQTAESKVLRGREREARERKSESTDKENDMKRKRTSAPNSDTEVKVKKRKI